VVRIDIDQAELKYSRVHCNLAIRSDAKTGLGRLLTALPAGGRGGREDWLRQVRSWRQNYEAGYDRNSKELKPQKVIEWVDELTATDDVLITTGVGSHQQWVARHFHIDYPRRPWLTSGGHGAMGFDLPTAIGAQISRPEKKVICLVGDGSLQINIQELAAVVEYGLPIKIVVLDNHRLAIVSQFQNLNWSSDPTCGNKFNPDFAAIARAYGLASYTISSVRDKGILADALKSPGPVLVHCEVDQQEDVVPMLLSGQTMDRMWPYYKPGS
jgi:acetolactate synthase-1/2/3 large subunit